MTIDPVIAWTLRLALALLFSAAAWHKLVDRGRFEGTLRAYALLPVRTTRLLSSAIPVVEVTIVIALLAPASHLGGIAAASLLLVYTAAIGINLARGRRSIDCGCFTNSSTTPLSNALVARNAALIAAACALVLPVSARPLVWVDWVTSLTALFALSLLWAAGQQLAQTGPALRRHGGPR
jgi:hypothetical protein